MPDYARNHYVPEWYQRRFLPAYLKEKKFLYLDLSPDTVISNGRIHKRKDLLHWGPPRCFCEDDLYKTKLGTWESTEIEEKFFGKVDTSGRVAVEYFDSFRHPSIDHDAFNAMLLFMSVQKLRTPKGLTYLEAVTNMKDKNLLLIAMQRLQHMFCALWTECIWSISDASRSQTKFIVSDHPVTVYNKECFPLSKWCRGFKDPDVWLSGTHTIYPLSLNKVLILTNLSWVRNPYMDPLKSRPNPTLFRPAIFKFTEIQTGRMLTDLEVNEINFIIKKRAFRYIAAAEKEWLYPERKLVTQHWDKLGKGYLLMPDPRSVTFSSEIVFGYNDSRMADWTDAYGRKPWQKGYNDKTGSDIEWITFHAFKGEFARIFGPKRRGQTYEYGSLDKDEDSAEYHASLLRQEQEYKRGMPSEFKRRGRKGKKSL